jgi:hypothetical protein
MALQYLFSFAMESLVVLYSYSSEQTEYKQSMLGDNNEQIGSLYIGDEYLKQSIWQKQVEFLMAAGVEPATIT